MPRHRIICRLLVATGGALVFGIAAPAEAQVCHGKVAFGPRRHVDVDAVLSSMSGTTLNSGHTRSLDVDFGGSHYFGTAAVGRNTYSDYGYSTTEIDAGFGENFDLLPQSKLVLCPESEIEVEHAANLGPGVPIASTSVTGIVSLRAGASRSVLGVPVTGCVGVGFFHSRTATSLVGDVPTSDYGGFAEIGGGVALLRAVDVVVSYRVPIGLKYGLTSTTLRVGVAF